MNLLVPFFFILLAIVPGDDDTPGIDVKANQDIVYSDVLSSDTLYTPDGSRLPYRVFSATGLHGCRDYLVTFGTDGLPAGISDLGCPKTSGVSDDLYITDLKGNTTTVIFTVETSGFGITESAEGGFTIEQSERITAGVIDHDAAEQTGYVLRHTTVVRHIDHDGHIRLQSIRPTADDLDAFVAKFRVYDRSGDDDRLLDATTLRSYLSKSFPVPK